MKPRTKQELAQLTKMNPGAFIESVHITDAESFKKFEEQQMQKPLFERIYDGVGYFINNGKSIATAELKSF